MGGLADVDPVAIARPHLLASERLTDVLGGGDRVRARNEPPYPCIVLTDPPGFDRSLTHLIAPALQIEVFGDLDGSQGKPLLRRILYVALEELAALPDVPVTDPTKPVVTLVESTGGGGWVPMPLGQPRYLATVRLWGHPGTE